MTTWSRYILSISIIISIPTAFGESESDHATETRIVEHESPGNLEMTNAVGCEEISSLKNKYTPPDLYAGLLKCFDQDKLDTAAAMFAVAGIYADFDQRRVTDTSAHQAKTVILMDLFKPISEEQKMKFQEIITTRLARDGDKLKSLCEAIRKLGAPDYYPTYMIQHGIKAFLPQDGTNPLQKDFDAKAAWSASLDEYLHCP